MCVFWGTRSRREGNQILSVQSVVSSVMNGGYVFSLRHRQAHSNWCNHRHLPFGHMPSHLWTMLLCLSGLAALPRQPDFFFFFLATAALMNHLVYDSSPSLEMMTLYQTLSRCFFRMSLDSLWTLFVWVTALSRCRIILARFVYRAGFLHYTWYI